MKPPNGVLIVNKARGPTSHDVVARALRLYETRAVGHAGTLDPMATGVLVLLFGEATKLSTYLTADDKHYRATVCLGTSTDTLDAEGAVVETTRLEPGWLDRPSVERALDIERSRDHQVPPRFSAIKVAGVRSHQLARDGQGADLAARAVRVHDLVLSAWTEVELTVELRVSKGYYVRSFARDVGASLGVPAHLTKLVRLASGSFRLDEACPLPDAPPLPCLITVSSAARRCLPTATLTEDGERAARFGQRLQETQFEGDAPQGPAAWFSRDDALVAIGVAEGDGTFRVLRGFRRTPEAASLGAGDVPDAPDAGQLD
jgi:tRNA pseudouridine55 synthase